MSLIRLEVKNCNNLDNAVISLAAGKLNIKFAPNGTGKSTIARALLLSLGGDQGQLDELMPFKFRKSNPSGIGPEVGGVDEIRNVMCFNEAYVSQFVFKQNELLNNSFDILIRTDEYKQIELEIEEVVSNIKKLFSGNSELESLISSLQEMGDAFKLSKSGLSKSSLGMKGLSAGNKIQHIPLGLESFKPFIQSENSVSWIEWLTKGYEFSELSDSCPFCTSRTVDKKDQIMRIGQEYDKNTIKNLIGLIKVIEKLGDYFSDDAKEKLKAITLLKEGIQEEHESFLVSVKNQIDTFTKKLELIRTLSTYQFKDGEKVSEKLSSYKLDLQFFSDLKSNKMQEAISPINASIDLVIDEAGTLQGKICQQRSSMKKTIERHQTSINEFLEYAGYRYTVEIVGEGDQAQLRLRHIDHELHLTGGNQYLSFGERNAFAIVLFMYECLSKKPDIIILDDPVSSFDKNKKYAILEMLFRRNAETCLKGKTVLMLTHDIEPIIDTVRSLKEFKNQTSSSFLKMKSGQLEEVSIGYFDIQTFSQICSSVIKSEKDEIIKLIYIRRNFEIIDNKSDAYQVLSNLLHGRREPVDSREVKEADDSYPKMNPKKFEKGCNEISEYLPGFSYQVSIAKINDVEALKKLYLTSNNGYEKLQIFRLFGLSIENTVIQKFINETYHIENEFICQLDPTKFDTIPEYVISACDKLFALGRP